MLERGQLTWETKLQRIHNKQCIHREQKKQWMTGGFSCLDVKLVSSWLNITFKMDVFSSAHSDFFISANFVMYLNLKSFFSSCEIHTWKRMKPWHVESGIHVTNSPRIRNHMEKLPLQHVADCCTCYAGRFCGGRRIAVNCAISANW